MTWDHETQQNVTLLLLGIACIANTTHILYVWRVARRGR